MYNQMSQLVFRLHILNSLFSIDAYIYISFHSNSINTSALTICELSNGMEYIILPRLASPSFYQLGEHLMIISGMVGNVQFGSQLQLYVESDTSELLS